MKKFGRSKKEDGDESSSRLALFGSRSKSKSPAPGNNPYAQQQAKPDPYTAAKIDAGIAKPPQNYAGRDTKTGYGGMSNPPAGDNKYGGMNGGGYGDSKSSAPAPQGGYGYDDKQGPSHGGYGATQYGNQAGYGSNRYGGSQEEQAGSRYGPGGYGGLGRTNSNVTTTTDVNRNELFGGARDRAQAQSPSYGGGAPPPYESGSGTAGSQSGAYGDVGNEGGYGANPDRQLTAEEEEEEDVQASKQQIRFIKQQDVASTRNALRVAAQAEETGRNTLARLGAQGERIHNTERNLDLAANHNRIAEQKARELKTLNKSMFAVHVNNPFTGNERRRRRDEEILDKHREEREQREATRQEAFRADQRLQGHFRAANGPGGPPKNKNSLAERSKYQFEADSEDEGMENEIDSNLDAMLPAAERLKLLAVASGEEIDAQNMHLDRIAGKVSHLPIRFLSCNRLIIISQQSDRVDDQIHMNRARLDRIH